MISLLMLVLWISLFKKFSRIVVYCLIIKVRFLSLSSDSSYILSHRFSLVKNFFQVFWSFFSNSFLLGWLSRVSLHILSCQFVYVNTFFTNFYIFFLIPFFIPPLFPIYNISPVIIWKTTWLIGLSVAKYMKCYRMLIHL